MSFSLFQLSKARVCWVPIPEACLASWYQEVPGVFWLLTGSGRKKI